MTYDSAASLNELIREIEKNPEQREQLIRCALEKAHASGFGAGSSAASAIYAAYVEHGWLTSRSSDPLLQGFQP